MSNPPENKKNEPTASPPASPPASPEDELNARIKELQAKASQLERETKILQGRLANRDQKTFQALKSENGELKNQLTLLEKAFFALLHEGLKPRNAEEEKLQYEILRQAAVEYCQKTNADPEIWKSIAS